MNVALMIGPATFGMVRDGYGASFGGSVGDDVSVFSLHDRIWARSWRLISDYAYSWGSGRGQSR